MLGILSGKDYQNRKKNTDDVKLILHRYFQAILLFQQPRGIPKDRSTSEQQHREIRGFFGNPALGASGCTHCMQTSQPLVPPDTNQTLFYHELITTFQTSRKKKKKVDETLDLIEIRNCFNSPSDSQPYRHFTFAITRPTRSAADANGGSSCYVLSCL